MEDTDRQELEQLLRDYEIAIQDASNEYNKAVNKLTKATTALPDFCADFYLGHRGADEVASLTDAIQTVAIERDVAAIAANRLQELYDELLGELNGGS